ncbi:MAG: hypothetical protein R2865_15560 [Deinococcales bacterium]
MLLIAIILYWTVLSATLLARTGRRRRQEPKIPFVTSREMRSEGTLKLLDNLLSGLSWRSSSCWSLICPHFITMFSNQIPVPKLKPW